MRMINFFAAALLLAVSATATASNSADATDSANQNACFAALEASHVALFHGNTDAVQLVDDNRQAETITGDLAHGGNCGEHAWVSAQAACPL